MFADHVDVDTLERVEEAQELGWTLDRRRFMTMLGGGAVAVAGLNAAPAVARRSSYLPSGVSVTPGVTDPVEYTVAELVILYERGKLSPSEVVQAYIDRIERYDTSHYKAYNAFVRRTGSRRRATHGRRTTRRCRRAARPAARVAHLPRGWLDSASARRPAARSRARRKRTG